jgi:hypothetical protein
MLVKLKRLSNPRVRRRLKIGLSVWLGVMLLGVSYKVVYDIGHFDARSLEENKNASGPSVNPKLTIASAQKIVTGALKEDYNNPQTVVVEVADDNYKLATVVIENKKQRKIAWIIEMRLFFTADVFNTEGYNLTKGFERHYELTP